MDLKYEIETILRCFEDSTNPDKLEIYAKAIQLNFLIRFGQVFYIDDFIACVERGSFIDWDGSAEAIDSETGKKLYSTSCNVEALKMLKEKGCRYIAWYNK